MAKRRRMQTVDQILQLEIGFNGNLGPAGLTEAIIEALTKGGVLEEAGIIYLKAEAPDEGLVEIDVWAPEPEEPPEIPDDLPSSPPWEGPEPNA